MPGDATPGWYVDPEGSGHQRWWDGERWHDVVPPVGQPAGALAVRPAPTRSRRRIVVALVLVLVGLGGCAAMLWRSLGPHGDVANAYLTAIREGDRAAADRWACEPLGDDRWQEARLFVEGAVGQDLGHINVTNGQGLVTGTITFPDRRAPGLVTIHTTSTLDGPCVTAGP